MDVEPSGPSGSSFFCLGLTAIWLILFYQIQGNTGVFWGVACAVIVSECLIFSFQESIRKMDFVNKLSNRCLSVFVKIMLVNLQFLSLLLEPQGKRQPPTHGFHPLYFPFLASVVGTIQNTFLIIDLGVQKIFGGVVEVGVGISYGILVKWLEKHLFYNYFIPLIAFNMYGVCVCLLIDWKWKSPSDETRPDTELPEMGGLRLQIIQLQNSLEQKDTVIQQLRSEIERLSNSLRAKDVEIARLNRSLREKDAELSTLQSTVFQLEAQAVYLNDHSKLE